MTAFRLWLAVILVTLIVYTATVFANHDPNLFRVFFGDIAKVGWPGQFNLDFLFMLTLSATWVAWRHRFSAAGLVLAFLAFNGGAMFLSIYLLIITGQAKGDTAAILTRNRVKSQS
jgi:hypothetical protein